MNRWSLIVKVAGGLVALWIVVYGIKALVAPHRATPERIEELVAEANLEDFSQYGDLPNDEVTRQRRESLEKVASVVNRLDLSGQEEARDTLEGLWDKLSASERRQFVDLTMESFTRFFEALDALTPEARRDFVERGFRELEDGTTERRLEKMMAKDPKIMERITQNGMKAYFENASAETKMEMAPFLKATNEVMQGIRGQPFQGGGM
ncbi:hypothetical protein [Roseibacillus persicicus]|uniref:Uncharacterized protein n=1 Tax=Roseibacillus persicicus TaxID=454148 RepID=A0A918TEE9_9BACT|nr:hypothetical protein [Roseibacillus persicicus]GHC43338.1 hypothetical protein GCM10007100_05570 [Roseibacillus persicicus]